MHQKITDQATAKLFLVESQQSKKKLEIADDERFCKFAFYQILLPHILSFSKKNPIDSPIFKKKGSKHYSNMLIFLIKANNIYRISPVECGWFFDKNQKKIN